MKTEIQVTSIQARATAALVLLVMAVSIPIANANLAKANPAVDATSDSAYLLHPIEAKSIAKKVSKGTSVAKVPARLGLGLDPTTYKLVNQGRFKDVIERLKGQALDTKTASRKAAWLAFAYMYLNQCQDLGALAKSLNTASSEDTDGIVIEAFSLICEKKLDAAEKKLQSLPASAMSDPFVNFAFAALCGKQGKASDALTYTQRTVELAPDFAWGFRTIGYLNQRLLNQPLPAETAYAQAVALEPDLVEAVNTLVDLRLVRNNFDGAIDAAKAAIKHAPKDPENYFRLAQIYIQQWRLREADVELGKSIVIDPNNAKYYRLRASISRYQGNLLDAIADLKKASGISSDKKVDLIDLAQLEVAAGKDADAEANLIAALALDPANQRANTDLVKLLTRLNKFDSLVTTLKAAVAKNPQNAVLRMYLGDALAVCRKPDQAIEQYKEAANLNQADPEPHRKIAAILCAEKDYRSAQKEYTRALNINPNSTNDLVALGFCYGATDDYLQAEAGYVTALALHQLTQDADSTARPTRLDIMRSLAALLFKEGRYADAAGQFDTIVAMGKSLPEAPLDRFMLAQAVALRDLTNSSYKGLESAFNDLPSDLKEAQRINYTDTLLRGDRFDDALAQLSQLSEPGQTVDTATGAQAKIDKDNPLALVCWSRAWRGKGDLKRAEDAARKALDISTKSGAPLSDVFCELGEVLLAQGDYPGAATNAGKAIEANDKSFRAHVLLGRTHLKSGRAKSAIEEANRSLQINPYFTEAYLLLGDAQVAGNDLKGADASYQKAVDLYPGLLQTHQLLLSVAKKLAKADDIAKEEAEVLRLKSQE